jgi:hypothetical protein
MSGQIDAMKGKWRIKKVSQDDYEWTMSPWDCPMDAPYKNIKYSDYIKKSSSLEDAKKWVEK